MRRAVDHTGAAPDRALSRPMATEPDPRLVVDFAMQLGLAPQDAQVRFDTHARAFGARGVVKDGVAHVDPDAHPLGSGAARALLAHEMTHLAQRAERVQAPQGDAEAAEREARDIGARAAALLPLYAPRAVLPKGAVARDTGTAVASSPAQPGPTLDTADGLQQRIDDQADNLSPAQTSARDRISATLDGIVTDGEMTQILSILDAHPFVTAAAMIRALPPDRRARIPGELGDQHHRDYARSALAAYAGLARTDVDRFKERTFESLPYDALRGLEVVALDLVLGEVERQRPRLLVALMRGEVGAEISARISRPFGEPVGDERDRARTTRDDETEFTESQLARAALLARRAQRILEDNENADAARQVLDMLRPLAPIVEPEPQADTSEQADDTPAPLDEFGGALRTVPPVLEAVAIELRRLGVLEVLFRATDRDDALGGTYAGLFFALMARRPVWENLASIQDLLSRSFFDWAIRDWEAQYAYRLLRAMPLEAQYRFRQLEGGVYYRRLEEEIPRDLIRSGVYVGIEVTEDETGQLVSSARDYADLLEQEGRDADILRASVNDVLRVGEEVRRHGNWRRLFEMLQSILATDPGVPHQLTALNYVVRRLDTLGVITPMIDGLPDQYLYAQDRRPVTMEIFLARDPIHLVEHARDLMSTNWWPWSLDTAVTDRDAYIAFRLIRALPPHEREQFFNRGGGEELAEIWSELHRRMRDSRDMHLFVSRDGGLNREDVIARLEATDPGETLWTPERRFELDAQIRMAIAFGAYDRVFRISEQQSAYQVAELAPIVARYRLFDRRPDSRRTEPDPDALPTSILSTVGALQFLQPLGRALYLTLPTITSLLDLFIFGSDFLLGRRGGGFRIDLERALNFAAMTLDQTQVRLPEGGTERDARGEQENTGMVWFNLPDREMHLRVPDLRLEGFNHLFGTTRVETGPIRISGLHVVAQYRDEYYTTPSRIQGDAQRLTVTSGGMLSPDTALTFGQVDLSALQIVAQSVDAVEGSGQTLPQGTWIPLPFMFFTMLGLFEVYSHLSALAEDETIQGLTGRTISFDRIDISGFSTSDGTRLQALAITDFDLGIATTPDQHLRNRIAQARRHRDRLSPTDRDGAAGQQLLDEISGMESQLEQADAVERERRDLARRYRQTPDSLSEPQVRRLVALERARRLGVTIDIGGLEATGLRSALDADRISLQGISGQGQGQTALRLLAATGLDRLADPAALGLFRERLDHEAGAAQGLPPSTDESLTLTIARVEAEGLGFTYVPDVEVLNQMIQITQDLAAAYPDPPRHAQYEDARLRLSVLLPRVVAYHELADQDVADLTQSQRIELARMRRQLRAAFYIDIGEAEATGVTLGLTLTPRAVGVSAGFEHFILRDIEGLGIEIESLEGERVDLSISLLVNMLQRVFRGQQDPGFDMVVGGGLNAGRLTLTGANAALFGVQVANLDVRGLESTAHRLENGWQVDIPRLERLTLSGVDLRYGQDVIQAPGTAVMIQSNLHMTLLTDPENDGALREIALSGHIGRLSYEGGPGPMIYQTEAPSFFQPEPEPGETPQAPRRMQITVHGGSLGGIDFDNLRYVAPTSETGTEADASGLHGGARVQTIDALQVAGLVHEAMTGGTGGPVVTHAAEGTVSSLPEAEVSPGAARAAALEVDFVSGGFLNSGGRTDVRMNEVDLSDGMLVIGDNRVTIRRLGNLGADVSYSERLIQINDLSFDDLAIRNFRWRTRGGVLLEARRSAHIHGFSLSGRIERETDQTPHVTITSMRIPLMTAGHFRYVDPGRNLTLSFDNTGRDNPEHQPIELTDFRVDGLDWSGGLPTSGDIHLGRLRTYFDATLGERFSANGSADAQDLNFQFQEGNRVVARIGRLDADADVTAGDTTTSVAVENLRTAEDGGITYTYGQGLSINKLRVGTVQVNQLTLDGSSMRIDIPIPLASGTAGTPVGDIRLEDIKLSAEIDFHPSEHEDAPAFQEIRITELEIPRISASGVGITLKSLGAEITLPESDRATIDNVRLGSTESGALFTVQADFDAGAGTTEYLLTGLLESGRINIPNIAADLPGILQGQGALTIDTVDADFLGAGGYQIDLNQPSLSQLNLDLGRLLPSAVFRLLRGADGSAPNLGAERIRLTPDGLEVLRAQSGAFEVHIPDMGVRVRAQSFSGTPDISIAYAEPVPYTSTGETDQVIRLNSAIFRDASIVVDDVSALLPEDTRPAGTEPDMRDLLRSYSVQYRDLIDTATGQVSLDIDMTRTDEEGEAQVPIDLDVRIGVTDGAADLNPLMQALRAQVRRLVDEKTDFGGWLNILRGNVDDDSFDIQLGEALYNNLFDPDREAEPDWITIVEFGLTDPDGTTPTGVTVGSVPLRALMRMNTRLGTMAESGGTTGPPQISNVFVDLSINNPNPFDFSFGTAPGTHGTIQLAPDGIDHFQIRTNLPDTDLDAEAAEPESSGPGREAPSEAPPSFTVQLNAERAQLQTLNVALSGGAGRVEVGAITVSNGSVGGAALSGWVNIEGSVPKRLMVNLAQIEFSDIEFRKPNPRGGP